MEKHITETAQPALKPLSGLALEEKAAQSRQIVESAEAALQAIAKTTGVVIIQRAEPVSASLEKE